MELASAKLLESATHRTLHAHAFSRSSTQASIVLTDLLSRYLALVAGTCAKYAGHAGRTGVTVHDALGALGEMGVGLEELKEYAGTEGRELGRYALWSARRVEDLGELKAQLKDGTRTDRDDAIPLVYAPFPEFDDDDEDDEGDSEDGEGTRVRSASVLDDDEPRIATPPAKRPRTANWEPPEHIPDFMPPFPTLTPPYAPEPSPATETPQPALELPPRVALAETKTPVAALTATSTSDYLMQVPYAQSSLSQVAEWHLPTAPRLQPTPNRVTRIETEPALVKAYHHILTHPPPAQVPNPTLARYKVSMALLKLTQNVPRWDPADTLYGNVAPNAPRVGSIGPTYPMGVGDDKTLSKEKEKEKFPTTLGKAMGATERLTPLVSQQGSRIQDLAKNVLPPVIMMRTGRLSHPPPLQRGAKPLVYGTGVPAPWNANVLPPVDGTGEEEKEKKEKAALGDARLYATWEVENKDFRVGIAPRRTRNNVVAYK
ncbi:hypothetical protein DXG01_013472 [Tephrocybe rancida]|nr:hypothetical protein DXG01_013472 [Tephrocybe rancida]